MADPTVAVIVPTYRRPVSLERCLRALATQTVAPDRVVIVVRDGDDETEETVSRLQAEVLPLEQAVVREPGAVAAIEAGLAHCTEEVVAHTDDDAVPHSDWLECLLASYGPGIGGVGGRDLVDRPTQVRARPDVVGKLTWHGRLIGNHHLGVGQPRDVDVLKGASMSLRRELWRLDRGLRGEGAQVHWEVGVCLLARGDGWRLVYDPAVQVDHFPDVRYDEDDRAQPTLRARSDAEWNYAYLLGRHLPLRRVPIAAAYMLGVGTRWAPGPVACVLSSARRPGQSGSAIALCAELTTARASGLVAGLRKRRARGSTHLGLCRGRR